MKWGKTDEVPVIQWLPQGSGLRKYQMVSLPVSRYGCAAGMSADLMLFMKLLPVKISLLNTKGNKNANKAVTDKSKGNGGSVICCFMNDAFALASSRSSGLRFEKLFASKLWASIGMQTLVRLKPMNGFATNIRTAK